MSNDFSGWMRERQERVELALERLLPDAGHIPKPLHTAMRHSTLGGGKRIRPLLAYAAGEIGAADLRHVDNAACALELIHVYSLVHDDLPCMDNDVLRRGKPTCHVAFGEPTALLAGDSLQSLAFECLASDTPGEHPARQIEMVRILAHASGSLGMAGGQAIDLGSVGVDLTLPELEFMHILKTGALISAAVQLGSLCGTELNPEHSNALKRYAHCVGLAFQVVDDVLDATGDSHQLGKTAGKDAEHDKPTYVSLMGIAAARELATDLHQQAIDAIAKLPGSDRLADLAHFILQRTS